jgi:hypothetical protein
MARSRKTNGGRSTTGEAAVPYYVESPEREAAKHLRLTAARFLTERASSHELDEAIKMWHDSTRAPTPKVVMDGPASYDCEALRAQLAQVDATLNVLDSDPTSRIDAIEYLIDRADGVEPATGEDLPDLEAAVSLMAAQRDEMSDVHRDVIFKAQAAMELIAELAMPDRALRREVRMRGVTAVVYDRMDKISGRGISMRPSRDNRDQKS